MSKFLGRWIGALEQQHLYAAHNVYDLNFCDIINLFKCRINIMPGITRATGFWLRQIVDIIAECISC